VKPILLIDVMDTVVRDPFWDMPGFFGYSFDALWPEVHPTAWVDFELGLIDEPTFLDHFFADGRAYDQAGFMQLVDDGFAWMQGMEELLAELRGAGFALHALSNYPLWWQRIERKLGLSRHLAWSFVSCDTGVRKPDPGAYTGAAEALGVAPGDCLFIDNAGPNCKGAAAVSMPAIKFVGAEPLRTELVARSLLP
jgi:FMN hydrolase / 5-amino-6-(5-phospho-D-ribitylamino)uracil phosphatase